MYVIIGLTVVVWFLFGQSIYKEIQVIKAMYEVGETEEILRTYSLSVIHRTWVLFDLVIWVHLIIMEFLNLLIYVNIKKFEGF